VAPTVELQVTLTASVATVRPGDSVTFVVSASGNNLIGVEMDYGDGAGDQYATGGAHTAKVTFRHAFSGSGTYVTRASVTDAIAGQKDATATVVVN
jgi:plastocyanin